MPTIELHPGAEIDFNQSFDWYAERSAKTAIGFADAINKAILRIAANPERFGHIDSIHQSCSVTRFPFSIVFRKKATCIEIIAVAHSMRSEDYWKDR